MKKSTLNLIIDILMFIAMGIVSFSGFALQYLVRRRCLPQFEQLRDVVGDIFGLGRRGWHEAHVYTSIILLVLLVLHIVLHWPSISAFFRRMVPNAVLRGVVYAVLVVVLLGMVVPWLVALPTL